MEPTGFGRQGFAGPRVTARKTAVAHRGAHAFVRLSNGGNEMK